MNQKELESCLAAFSKTNTQMLMILRVFHLMIFSDGTCGQFSSPYLVYYMRHNYVLLLKFGTKLICPKQIFNVPVVYIQFIPVYNIYVQQPLIAERLSVRQLILICISFCTCMYVCMYICMSVNFLYVACAGNTARACGHTIVVSRTQCTSI